MSTFGDYEPEDSWDATDPTPVLIRNLFARIALLERTDGPPGDLDELDRRLIPLRARRDEMNARAQLRLDQLDNDLEYLRIRGDD